MKHAVANTVGIIGVGPRGLSVLERIVENSREQTDTTTVVHLVEHSRFGSGYVWRTDQSPALIMNIVASQITAFTDETVEIAGPIRKGPNLHEWAAMVAAGTISGRYPKEVVEEAEATHANSYCRRSFYGHYLEWVYSEITRRCPDNIIIHEHRCKAVSTADTGNGDQAITLENGRMLEVSHLVLALGHTTVAPSAEEKTCEDFAAKVGGAYYRAANPADVDLSTVEPDQPVLIRGLGLCFFDYMALFTIGRGGEYVRNEHGLSYCASGDEPHIVCGSRRGIPLHARADNEKGDQRHEPTFLTEAEILRLQAERVGGLDFRRDCWPLIAKEVETVYYTRLVASRISEDAAEEFCALYSAAPWSSEAERVVLCKFGIPESRWWDWSRVDQPWTDADISTLRDWRGFIRSYLVADVIEACRGNITSPVKAALDVLRDIRNEIRYVMNNGGVDGDSYAKDVAGWFNSLHSFVSIGPPWSRIEEMVALMDAGIVEVAGPEFSMECNNEEEVFVGRSTVPGDLHRGTVLVDAMLPGVDLDRTTNLVLAQLKSQRQLKNFSVSSASADDHVTGGVAVTERPFRAIKPDGSIHPRRYVFGVPTEGANWVTETGIRPNVNSITLGDSDVIARSVLGLVHHDSQQEKV